MTPSDTHLAVNIPEQRSAVASLNEEAYQTSSEFMRHSPQPDTKWPYPASPTYPFLGVGSASPSQWISSTSVLLSPAPSSLGSSREELSVGDTARLTTQPYPWPSPVWHCFQPGWYWLLVWLVWSLVWLKWLVILYQINYMYVWVMISVIRLIIMKHVCEIWIQLFSAQGCTKPRHQLAVVTKFFT